MLLSEKIKTIPPIEFWHSYTVKSVVYNALVETKPLLSLRIYLDNVFGSLTTHEFESKKNELNIKCQKCEYVATMNSDICETHLGFISGMLNKVNGKECCAIKTIEGIICNIKVKELNEQAP